LGVGGTTGLGAGLDSLDEGASVGFLSPAFSVDADLTASAGFPSEAFEEFDEPRLPEEPEEDSGFGVEEVAPGRIPLSNSFHLIARASTTPIPIKIKNNRASSNRLPARSTRLLVVRMFSGT